MSKAFNPLKKNKQEPLSPNNTMTASDGYSADRVPLSPISGKPMERALCRDVPVWCDLANRLILPIKKAE